MKKYTLFLFFFSCFLMFSSHIAFSATWSLEISSDKDEYIGGENVSFDMQITKDGELVSGNSVDYIASFPESDYSVALNPSESGFFYLVLLNDLPAQQILKVTLYEKNHEEKIVKNEEKIEDLQARIEELEQKKLEKPDKADKFDKKIAELQQKIADLQAEIEQLKQPLTEAEKTLTVLSRNAFKIKEGEYTNHTDVILLIASNDSYELMVSENEDFSSAGVIPYQLEITYNLSSGDGEKIVYVKFILKGTSFEEVKNNSIILDTIAPVVEALSPIDGAVVTGKPEITE